MIILTKKFKLLLNKVLVLLPTKQRFSFIYRTGLWFSNKESQSGAGSTLDATTSVREKLPEVLDSLRAKKMIDIGCGDFNWMNGLSLPCTYLGVDVVRHVIEHCENTYSNIEGVDFLCLDAVNEKIPNGYDVALCREVLFHLSFSDGIRLIENIKQSQVRYLIATTDSLVDKNHDKKTGLFRNINLFISPYNLPPSILKIEDSYISNGRALAVIDLNA